VQQHYWNEYDNGSERGDINEPYTIYVDPNTNPMFPGVNAILRALSSLSSPVEKITTWMSRPGIPAERRPLLHTKNRGYLGTEIVPARDETDPDDDVSSNDFPEGFVAHAGALPSVKDQRLSRQREKFYFGAAFGSLAASLVLIFIAGLLVTTGRHRLGVEVDAGAIVAIISSLLFAAVGFTMVVYQWAMLGWLHKICVTASFTSSCILDGILLVLVTIK
jgi:hypothetical protein